MVSTCAHHYPHTKFCHCTSYRTLDICLFCISQSEQIWKWGIKYVHSVTTVHVCNTCAPLPLPTYQVLPKSVIVFSLEKQRYLFCWQATYIHPHIHTSSIRPSRQRDNENLSDLQHSWRPIKNGQLNPNSLELMNFCFFWHDEIFIFVINLINIHGNNLHMICIFAF